MKALTLHQPWASLIAVGAKTIETRSWSTHYRGPLAIHAGKKRPPVYVHHNVNDDVPAAVDRIGMPWEWTEHPDDFMHGGAYRWAGPLGAVVATCTLVDCVPIYHWTDGLPVAWQRHVAEPNGLRAGELWLWNGPSDTENLSTGRPTWLHDDITDQRPYGDFTPGRFAWVLDDIAPLDHPAPARGRQGLWNWEPGSVVTS